MNGLWTVYFNSVQVNEKEENISSNSGKQQCRKQSKTSFPNKTDVEEKLLTVICEKVHHTFSDSIGIL